MRLIGLWIIGLLVLSVQLLAESDTIPRKYITAVRVSTPPEIDGDLSDPIWENVPVATGFRMLEPDNGPPLPDGFTTEVKITYDDEAIYFAARLNDPNPDSILTEVSRRDQTNRNNDYFGVFINPYNDGQNDINFFVTASGVQQDSRTTVLGDDFNWNAVWESAVVIDQEGWKVELKIPYMALRLPETEVQTWGLNIGRYIRRTRELYTWNFINRAFGTYEQQNGRLTGIENIETPVRLSLMPYASTYANMYEGDLNMQFNAGLDLKYGLSDAYTLDVTLIPDFGQARFDNVVLNLSPFEVRFDEYRQFFTEGTEIFNKGDLFYSRRVGGRPAGLDKINETIQPNESVLERPSTVNLINSFKISGRNSKRLGIGVFNATTRKTFATLQNNETDETREVLVEPLSNYNMLVVDQLFGQNNYVTLINTNVTRLGDFRDANVTGGLFQLQNKKNSLAVSGQANLSVISDDEDSYGQLTQFSIRDIRGNWRWSVDHYMTTRDYDPNDLGFLNINNELNHSAELSFVQFKPWWKVNRFTYTLGAQYNRLQNPNEFREFFLYLDMFTMTRDFLALGGYVQVNPVASRDYYETRDFDYFFRKENFVSANMWFSSDYRNPFALDGGLTGYQYDFYDWRGVSMYLRPVFRINDHLSGRVRVDQMFDVNDIGWVGTENGVPVMGRRNRNTTITAIDANYNFNALTFLNLTFRHYWSEAGYKEFYEVQNDGTLQDINYNTASDVSFNSWNLDLSLEWWFAPGSQLTLLYRNVIRTDGDEVLLNMRENFDLLFNSPAQNSFSIRVLYFFDYNYLKKSPKA